MVTLQETKYEEIGSSEHERHGDADTLEEVSPIQRRRRRGDWTAAATTAGA